MLHNKFPDISTLRVFGSLCYASTLKSNRKKLDSRSRKSIHLGYKRNVNGHILFDLQCKEVFISRDVVFFKHLLSYNQELSQTQNISPQYVSFNHSYLDGFFDNIPHSSSHTRHKPFISNSQPNRHNDDIISSTILHNESQHTMFESPRANRAPTEPQNPPLRKSIRIPKPSSYLQDCHCNLMTSTIHNSATTVTNHSSSCKYPLSSSLSYDSLSIAHKLFTLNMSIISKPQTYEKTTSDDNWRNAINVELTALMKIKTWDLVHLPPNKKSIGFKLKMHANVRTRGLDDTVAATRPRAKGDDVDDSHI
ncbi:hypothetical protein KIW84_021984 [Lathyrus oleraceus]|uniref:Retroviral polymerase SH3-like domain-containing protein n=1 Tax=Pisum sativum TaxID=3888 RepID=A0A9D4YBD3_PEA|nr:hypothetical protein KIW84_021984 [Pisum sativum]